ncbi:MAG: hypothetical protein H7301_05880 [Cryobacterium sp.]|nr:hypothetical protein [Oligoflexia bacterium]
MNSPFPNFTRACLALILAGLSCSSILGEASDAKLSLSARVERMSPRPAEFFFPPKTELERSLLDTGLTHYWQRYGKKPTPDRENYHGYILFADPYHRGLKLISFLLGSDCSNFVHRFYQMLGANIPFLKTRHWIHLSQAVKSGDPEAYFRKQNASDTPIDLKFCVWKSAIKSFRKLENERDLDLGDIVVYPRSEGVLGKKGHMGVVVALKPTPLVLQSKFSGGISTAPLESGERSFLRFTGDLSPNSPASVPDALLLSYPESVSPPSDCHGQKEESVE